MKAAQTTHPTTTCEKCRTAAHDARITARVTGSTGAKVTMDETKVGGETHTAEYSRMAVKQKDGVTMWVAPCEYFYLCENPADGTVSNPILGPVPCCDRCARTVGAELETY
jgi:hypothetical protein